MTLSLSALQTRALVLDIEGTTTPIDFVYKVLFPFARTHAAEYLSQEGEAAACRAATAQLEEERDADIARGELVPAGQILAYVTWLMDRDRKSPGLKALQGLIWQEGYRSGELRGEVYPDVRPAFERWRASGRDIYIYSSGSVLAQQLLFGTSNAGDLTACLKGYFDTAVGPKTSPDSYRIIAERVQAPPREILFLSDVTGELDAARTAGLQTALCVRDGDPLPVVFARSNQVNAVVHSFDDITE